MVRYSSSFRHNHGYVTKTQFQQCLSQLGITLTTDEVQVLVGCFSDNKGVNYVAVLQHVDPSVPEQNKYQLRLAMLTQPDKVYMCTLLIWLLCVCM